MSFCKECGFKLSEEAKFCPNCGNPALLKEVPKDSDLDFNKTIKHTEPTQYGTIRLEDLPVGFVIDERYEIKEKLGQGGFGAVYRVWDRKMEIDKALKVIPEAVTNDIEVMEDLRREARTMIGLNHPGIVRVYDLHNRGDIQFLDMEYINGKTLTELKITYPDKRIPEDIVITLSKKISESMVYAHSKGVIHKDIKPQNIMITDYDEIKIMDFGIAETVRSSMSRIQNTSSSGTLVYMSPEQIRGKDVGKESDIYSFGSLVYELLSGHPPFYRGDITYQVMNETPKKIEGISAGMNRILQKCLAKEYEDRYRSFNEILDELNRLWDERAAEKVEEEQFGPDIEDNYETEKDEDNKEKEFGSMSVFSGKTREVDQNSNMNTDIIEAPEDPLREYNIWLKKRREEKGRKEQELAHDQVQTDEIGVSINPKNNQNLFLVLMIILGFIIGITSVNTGSVTLLSIHVFAIIPLYTIVIAFRRPHLIKIPLVSLVLVVTTVISMWLDEGFEWEYCRDLLLYIIPGFIVSLFRILYLKHKGNKMVKESTIN